MEVKRKTLTLLATVVLFGFSFIFSSCKHCGKEESKPDDINGKPLDTETSGSNSKIPYDSSTIGSASDTSVPDDPSPNLNLNLNENPMTLEQFAIQESQVAAQKTKEYANTVDTEVKKLGNMLEDALAPANARHCWVNMSNLVDNAKKAYGVINEAAKKAQGEALVAREACKKERGKWCCNRGSRYSQ